MMLLRIIQKRLPETFFMQTPMYIAEYWFSDFPKYGVKCIEKLKSHCTNTTFADKSRYDRNFQPVTHKGGEFAINYIKRFQNAHALSVSVGNSYSEDQLIHTFLDNFHQGGKYSAQIASHQAELRREENLLTKNHWTSLPYRLIT